MKYFDIHSHLNLEQFHDDYREVISLLEEKEVGTITVGVDEGSSARAVELSSMSENLYAAVGLHPTETDRESFNSEFYEKLITNPKVVCVGECGLDYFRMSESDIGVKDRQKAQFRAQIEFAIKYDKPLMLHIRPSKNSFDAYEDVLEILLEYKAEAGKKLRGDAHFFAGNLDIARKFIDLGFYISLTGVITFTHDYDEVVRGIPIDKMLSETDAPYVAPVPYRGKRAEPWYVISVVEKLAELREIPLEEMKIQLLKNTKSLFNI
ncbi:TatD family hydrolase [Candidatus Parcubacteria bacterium]|nr:TatD family hydrolase [Candidatus Parcubacteria bacterium]